MTKTKKTSSQPPQNQEKIQPATGKTTKETSSRQTNKTTTTGNKEQRQGQIPRNLRATRHDKTNSNMTRRKQMHEGKRR